MLREIFVGYLGADAKKQEANGRKFTTFRAAQTDRWTDQAGTEHEATEWVDFVLNDHPKVADYLVKGQMVYVEGSSRLRVFSSEKERCMKAARTISITRIELIGARPQGAAVPSRLVGADGRFHDVVCYYHTDCPGEVLTAQQGGKQFAVDDNGWVLPLEQVPAEAQQAGTQQAATQQQATTQQAETQLVETQLGAQLSNNPS